MHKKPRNRRMTKYNRIMRRAMRLSVTLGVFAWWPTVASAQTVTVVHNVNLRPDPSSKYPAIRLLGPAEPPLTLLEPTPEAGYYHVKTSIGEEGRCPKRQKSRPISSARP